MGAAGTPLATISPMLAANIWHWWIGVILTLVGVLSVAGLVGGYLKNVTSQQYPGKRQRRDD
jgi:hypothetical protein